jgi:hypothetical protein
MPVLNAFDDSDGDSCRRKRCGSRRPGRDGCHGPCCVGRAGTHEQRARWVAPKGTHGRQTTPHGADVISAPEPSAPFPSYAGLLQSVRPAQLEHLIAGARLPFDWRTWDRYLRGFNLPSALIVVLLHDGLDITLQQQREALLADIGRWPRCPDDCKGRIEKTKRPDGLRTPTFAACLRDRRDTLKKRLPSAIYMASFWRQHRPRWWPDAMRTSEDTVWRLETSETLPTALLYFALPEIYQLDLEEITDALRKDLNDWQRARFIQAPYGTTR